MNDNASECDLIVVGAGIYGIQVARTYLELHPARSVAILEASDSVGGVWSNGKSVKGRLVHFPTDFAVKSVYMMTSGRRHL